jgi:hypothetical protein
VSVRGAGSGNVMILWGWDTNGTTGAHAGGGAGPAWEAGTGRTWGGRARVRVGVDGWVGRLVGWFDLWVKVIDQCIHHPMEYSDSICIYVCLYIYIESEYSISYSTIIFFPTLILNLSIPFLILL